ncbi:hypothetical protein TRFO_37020 [Tritrichomonas foetus]|uniref:Uncharacterized protein n=1 Tax=Tritrichomonas foetus TaxID=1144522 RepID=A0A1J4JH10_9EUKA|nr:hypothetical protein TRFO_37020 [Tritrichomonas foetus]|eukprot:OHS96765.1 hypothetical protein TRFO_37020 [Tritrichomonas foetus]
MNVQYSALQRKARLVRNGAKANVMIPGYTENMKIRSVGSNIINLSGCGKLADTSNCLIKRNPKGIAKSRTLNEPFIMIPKVTSSLRINKY